MLNITFIYLGAPKESFFREALDEYEKRLSRFCKFTEKCIKPENIPQNPGDNEIKNTLAKEKAKIVEAIPKGAYKIAMCIEGKTMSSEKLAELFEELPLKGFSDIAFIIGSSHGLDESLKKECDMRLSMSPMTFAHSLAAVMLTEQIYRGFCIINGDKYHK